MLNQLSGNRARGSYEEIIGADVLRSLPLQQASRVTAIQITETDELNP